NGFQLPARNRHGFVMLPNAHPQLSTCDQLIHNHHVQKLPRIDELWPIGTKEAQHRDLLEQRDFWVDDKRLLPIIDHLPWQPVGRWLGPHQLIAHMIVPGCLRIRQQPWFWSLERLPLLLWILPAYHAHGGLLHAFTRQVIDAFRRRDDEP